MKDIKSNNDRNKRERRDRTEEILQAASQLFSQSGFHSTNLASIAKAVGLTEPGLLHYFPTKVHLLQGVLNYRDEKDKEKYMAMVDTQNLKVAELIVLLNQLVAENQQKPAIVRLFTLLVSESIQSSHPAHDYFVERYELGRRTYREVLLQMKEAGHLKTDVDLEHLGTLILAMMDGLQIQWLLDPGKVDLTELFKLFARMLEDFLTK